MSGFRKYLRFEWELVKGSWRLWRGGMPLKDILACWIHPDDY